MARFFIHDGTSARELDVEAFCTLSPPPRFSWVHMDGRTDDVAKTEARIATIPDAARSAMMASETRPRCTIFADGALVNLRGLGEQLANDGDPLVSIRLWAEKGRVVSLSYRRLDILNAVIEEMLSGRLADPGDLITAVAIHITDALDPVIADLGDALDNIESHLDEEGAVSTRRHVAKIRAAAISFRRFIAPQRAAMERLMTAQVSWLEADDRLHVQEAADRCARMAEELEAVRERSALAHEALTDLRAEHMNRQALLLAIVALIFLPLTFLTGLLGMNVNGIPYAHEPWAFWGVIAVCTIIAGAIGAWFAVTNWLQR
ncbi:zinc transporter ZntB [Sphingobium subterraneum]|uniref:Zinc transporter n=1 Tax=Sphingobium subterraneum TaxID=627688 RepID=A0A841J1Z6_9SPHN|nr:zinc transporter ZntB [Sphingobium subterraneum]MBB6124847.1 zinc transporter [Sphingobium subterraneum]